MEPGRGRTDIQHGGGDKIPREDPRMQAERQPAQHELPPQPANKLEIITRLFLPVFILK